jgi:hypothetical protein
MEGPKTLILMSEGLVLDTPSELDNIIRAAAYARVTINVLLMDVPRDDITVGQLGPTVTEDRDMQVSGLADLAAGSRGSLQHHRNRRDHFERLAGDMLAYYLLGVEQIPGDRDGEAHRVDVEVMRRNVTVKSRRAFVLSSATTTRRKAEETLLDTLKSPFGVAEVPVRVTTFTQKDPTSDKARIVVAAEVGQPGGEPEEFTVGYVLLDSEGMVVSGSAEKRVLSVPNGVENAPRDYLGEIVVEPGNYSLRFGVVDATGRRGGVIREVNAWKLGGEEFALGDLLVGDAGNAGTPRIRPGVEPRVHGNLGAFMELYATANGTLDTTKVSFEIADDQDSQALLTGPSEIVVGTEPTQRRAQGVLSATLLPPGVRGARKDHARRECRRHAVRRSSWSSRASRWRRRSCKGVAVRSTCRDDGPGTGDHARSVGDSPPEGPRLRRAGRYGSAAVEALTSGEDQKWPPFSRASTGARRRLNQADATRGRGGTEARVLCCCVLSGAAVAAAGRDRDAAGVADGARHRDGPLFVYTLLADARLRDGQPGSVIDILKPAYRTHADDDMAIG